MPKLCIKCETHQDPQNFYVRKGKAGNICKGCEKTAKRKEYNADLKTSRIIAKVRHETDEKYALRRVRNYMKRYEGYAIQGGQMESKLDRQRASQEDH